MYKGKDLSNQIFGKLTVVKLSEDKSKTGRRLWECICECGNIRYVEGAKLTGGQAKTCGCSRKAKYIPSEYVGNTYGKWYVKGYKYNEDKDPVLECICECGTIRDVLLLNIAKGYSTNCGCVRKKKMSEKRRKDLIGEKYGKLTVLSEFGKSKASKIKYKCKCDCGNECVVIGSSMISGHTTSCGCTLTQYNKIISDIVNKIGFEFKTEYSVNITKTRRLRFDVYIPSINLAIEYDGEGHYTPIDFGGKGEEWALKNLQETQKRDKEKDNYCIVNKIHLLRIPYYMKDNMEEMILNKINEINYTNND